MSSEQFDIIFRGDIVMGHNLADVKTKLQQLFKTDAAKIDALFSGKPTPLKRGLDEASAQKYKEVLLKVGAQVVVVSSSADASVVKSSPPPNAPAVKANQPAVTQPTPSAAPKSLAERLAEQAAAQEAEAAKQATLVAERQAAAAAKQAADIKAGTFSLAAVGSDLLAPNEKAQEVTRNIDLSHLSLREAQGNLIDEREIVHQSPVIVADLSVSVAEAGSLLIREDEKNELPLPEFDVADWGIAAEGSLLITEAELPPKNIPVIEELHVGLAPVGSDLGQLKKEIPPVVPDISKLSLQ